MDDQLTLGLEFEPEPASEPRRYECCGLPCGELPPPIADPDYGPRARALAAEVHPHADDCTNTALGVWIDRATGWPLRRLKCTDRPPCPYGGKFPQRPGLADPYNGRCCLELAVESAAATPARSTA